MREELRKMLHSLATRVPRVCLERLNITGKYHKVKATSGESHDKTLAKSDNEDDTVCDTSLRTNAMKKHLKVHNKGKSWKCDNCYRVFVRKYNYVQHQKLYCGMKHSCNVCQKTFHSKEYLKCHLRIHTGVKMYKCKECNKSFTFSESYSQHIKTHSKKRPYVCDVCDSTFKVSNDLRKHKLIHLEIRPYSCEICGKTFARKSHIREHVAVHGAMKSYSCQTCNKSFIGEYPLRRHELLHEEKKFTCNYCGKKFHQKSVCQGHIYAMHIGKTYKCRICNKTFSYLSNLKRHLIIHSTDKPFVCVCGSFFKSKAEVVLHTPHCKLNK